MSKRILPTPKQVKWLSPTGTRSRTNVDLGLRIKRRREWSNKLSSTVAALKLHNRK